MTKNVMAPCPFTSGTHRLRIRRLRIVSGFVKTLVGTYLTKLSRQHIDAGESQRVIFSFDHIGHDINLHGLYERNELHLIRGWLRSNGLMRGSAVDIDANIGNHSLFFSKDYTRVFSFEPNPRTYGVLELNAKASANISTFNYGLSDKADSVILTQDNSNVGHSTLTPEGGAPNAHTRFTIEVVPLDDVVALKNVEIGLLKIDVEGHELQVLKGAERIIAINKPVILFELHAREIANGSSPVVELLNSIGYLRFAVVEELPRLPAVIPHVLRYPLTLLARLAFGTTYAIKELKVFKSESHNIVIAIPERHADSPVSDVCTE